MTAITALIFTAMLATVPAPDSEYGHVGSAYGHVKAASLDPSQAQSDALRDVTAGHCSVYGYNGYSFSIPNAPDGGDEAKIMKHFTIVAITDTADYDKYPNQRELNANARAYAAAYNEVAIAQCLGKMKRPIHVQ